MKIVAEKNIRKEEDDLGRSRGRKLSRREEHQNIEKEKRKSKNWGEK